MKKINYPKNVKNLYLKIFSAEELQTMQSDWENTLNNNTYLKKEFPHSIIDILTGDFKMLTDIYFKYQKILKNDATIKNTFIKYNGNTKYIFIFNYKDFYPKIINFFCKYSQKMNIHSCFYCDIQPVGKYTKKKNNPRLTLDLDHFYPKDQCPILALSLKNFVPSCQVCNCRIKNKTPLLELYKLDQIKDEKIIKQNLIKLSPTSNKYHFNKQTKIIVKPVPGFTKKGNFLKNIRAYRIKFLSNDIYKKEIKAFYLEQRYNSITILSEALSILDLKQKFPRVRIKELKQIFDKTKYSVTEEDIEEIIFRKKYDENRHSNLLKMKKDLLE